MTSNMIAGIDYSMTSPAICVYDRSKPFAFESCLFFVYSDIKKLANVYGRNLFVSRHGIYTSEQERFDLISEWAMAILLKFNIAEVCMEGYSMGSSGRVFNIAENGGLLKHKMWKEGIRFECPAPTQVKKLFSGKGNAKKEEMHAAFEEKTNISIISILNMKPDASPVADIVDSFAMVDWYLHHI